MKKKIRDVQIHERLKELRKEKKKYAKKSKENAKKYAKHNTVAEPLTSKKVAEIYDRMNEEMELLIEKNKISNEEIMTVLEKTEGNISRAAKILELNDTTLYRKAKKDPEIKEFLELLDQRLIDLAKDVLREKLETDKDLKAAIFLLETKGKDEGFHKKVVKEVSGKDGKPIEVKETTAETIKRADKAINKAIGII